MEWKSAKNRVWGWGECTFKEKQRKKNSQWRTENGLLKEWEDKWNEISQHKKGGFFKEAERSRIHGYSVQAREIFKGIHFTEMC